MSDESMTLDAYQAAAQRTARACETRHRLTVAALGICGEAGEVSEHVKKHVGHGHVLDIDAVAKEIGDVLWYCAEIASTLGLTLGDVADRNIAKLRVRYPDGFDEGRSRNRPHGNGG